MPDYKTCEVKFRPEMTGFYVDLKSFIIFSEYGKSVSSGLNIDVCDDIGKILLHIKTIDHSGSNH